MMITEFEILQNFKHGFLNALKNMVSLMHSIYHISHLLSLIIFEYN